MSPPYIPFILNNIITYYTLRNLLYSHTYRYRIPAQDATTSTTTTILVLKIQQIHLHLKPFEYFLHYKQATQQATLLLTKIHLLFNATHLSSLTSEFPSVRAEKHRQRRGEEI